MKKLLLSTWAFAAMAVNAQNLVEVTFKDGSVQTFQTSSLQNIKFNGSDAFSITNDEGAVTEFNGNVSNIRFSKHHAIDGSSAQSVVKSIGLGWNLGNNLDAQNNGVSSETAWGNSAATLNTFLAVKQAGFSAVRIPVTWMGHIGAAPDYTIEEAYLNRVAEVVGYAKEAGLKAIINIHHDGADSKYWLDISNAAKNEATQTQIKQQLAAMWTQIAKKFKTEGDYLIFEAMNEIQDGGWGWGANRTDGGAQYRVLHEWLQTFVDAVRAVGGENTYRYLGVPGYSTDPDLTVEQLKIPTDVVENRLLVAAHFYVPYTYTLEDKFSEWGHNAVDKESWGDESAITSTFSKLKTAFLDKNYPVYLGEFGCVRRENDYYESFRKYYLEYLCKAASDYGLALFYWDNGYSGYGKEQSGLFDHGTGAYLNNAQEIVDVMVSGYYNDDPAYTLQSVYDAAPAYVPVGQR